MGSSLWARMKVAAAKTRLFATVTAARQASTGRSASRPAMGEPIQRRNPAPASAASEADSTKAKERAVAPRKVRRSVFRSPAPTSAAKVGPFA